MSNQVELYDGLDSLKNSVFEEIEKSGDDGIIVSDIVENLRNSSENKAWRGHKKGAIFLVWSFLYTLASDGKVTMRDKKGNKEGRVFAIN